jgi:hypothetical protein
MPMVSLSTGRRVTLTVALRVTFFAVAFLSTSVTLQNLRMLMRTVRAPGIISESAGQSYVRRWTLSRGFGTRCGNWSVRQDNIWWFIDILSHRCGQRVQSGGKGMGGTGNWELGTWPPPATTARWGWCGPSSQFLVPGGGVVARGPVARGKRGRRGDVWGGKQPCGAGPPFDWLRTDGRASGWCCPLCLASSPGQRPCISSPSLGRISLLS